MTLTERLRALADDECPVYAMDLYWYMCEGGRPYRARAALLREAADAIEQLTAQEASA